MNNKNYNNKYYDAHTHLIESCYKQDFSKMTIRFKNANISKVICNATSPDNWLDVLNLYKSDHSMIPALGIHPWYVENLEKNWNDTLNDLLSNSEVALIGEIGLDKLLTKAPFELQKHIFKRQLEIAIEHSRNLCIHCVKAWPEMLQILNKYSNTLPKFMIHAFVGSIEIANEIISMGGYLSFAGNSINSTKTQNTIKQIPIDKLLIETDSPDMIPKKPIHTEKINGCLRNEPINVISIYKNIAKLRNIEINSLCLAVENNFAKFTNLTNKDN